VQVLFFEKGDEGLAAVRVLAALPRDGVSCIEVAE